MAGAVTDDPLEGVRTGGIDLDEAFRPRVEGGITNKLYCVAIAFLLHKLPFIQGITSSHDLGQAVAKTILADIDHESAVGVAPDRVAV